MRALEVSPIGFPLWSFAGVKRARRMRIEQVVLSSELDPEDDVTLQFDTRPLEPIVRLTAVVPCSSLRSADCG